MGFISDITRSAKDLVKHPVSRMAKIATGGMINKDIDKLKEKVWDNSSLRDIYMKNQHLINTTAGMAAAGILGPAALGYNLTGAAGSIAPGLLAKGIGAGALYGYSSDKKEREKQKLKEQQILEAQNKAAAGQRVDDVLEGITGDPDSPVTGAPGTAPIPNFNPGPIMDPVSGQPLLDDVMGDTPLYGGAVNTGGTASKDQNDLINEAELAYKLQQERAGQSKEERAQMLQEYADLIAQQQNRMLDENAPALYEDLNTRGLLRSSELGNAMSRERAKAAAILQEQVGLQGLSDRDAYIQSMEGASDNYLGGRSGAIQRRFSLEDFARQAQVAKDTGIALQPISTGTPSGKGGDAAMVSAGANVATAIGGKGR